MDVDGGPGWGSVRPAMLDLHTHTRHSDGLTTPEDNARMAAAAGLAGVALTDHDTFAGWAEMGAACRRRGLRFVPGVELSAEDDGASVHLLGYWVDPENSALSAECDRLAGERLRRAEEMLALLAGLGIEVPLSEVLERAGGASIARPHIAEALVSRGAAPDVASAFEWYVGDWAPAHVPKRALAPEAAVALIRGAGGVAVLAHPAAERGAKPEVAIDLLDRLTAAGLAGVEADHPGHDEDGVSRWRVLAQERDLLVTGSSDFHGRYEEERIGRCATAPAVVDRLSERAASQAP